MKEFFIKISILIAGLFAIFQLSYGYVKKKSMEHLSQTIGAGTIEKHQRLSTLPSPKMVLVGGSNVMFGFDSELMEKELKMPVQNMALGAALGLEFILKEVKADIKSGDNILLSLEYYLDNGDYNTKLYIEELNPVAKNYISYETKIDSFKINANYALRKMRNHILFDLFSKKGMVVEDEAYGRNAFTERGDIKDKLRLIHRENLQSIGNFNMNFDDGIKKINDFVAYAKQKNAKVYFSFPPVTNSEYTRKSKEIASFYEQLKSKTQLIIINRPQDSIYPDTCFYDTSYHLRSPYHRKHSENVVSALKKELG